ncbi:MAG: hypothetical protein NDI80_04420 [Flavobacteriaceae bacterium]|nr:hypothetical protein [Flavobacteriaceae bacterium]
MENIKIDSETANCIVQIYKKINAIKGLLNEEPYTDIKKIIECGTELSEMMNNAFQESTQNGLESELNALSMYLKKMLFFSSSIQNIMENREISELLKRLLIDISTLQLKFNAKK